MSSRGAASASTTSPADGGYPTPPAAASSPCSPYCEQQQVYNAINFNYNIFGAGNTTVTATSLSYLHCPSDPAIENQVFMAGGNVDGGDMTMCYSSYGGNAGTWFQLPRFSWPASGVPGGVS